MGDISLEANIFAAAIQPTKPCEKSALSRAKDTRTTQGWSSPARNISKPRPPRPTTAIGCDAQKSWKQLAMFYLPVHWHMFRNTENCPKTSSKTSFGPPTMAAILLRHAGVWVQCLWPEGPMGIMVGKSVEWILFLIPSCLIFISQMEHQKSRIHTQPKEFSARSGNNPSYVKFWSHHVCCYLCWLPAGEVT